MLTGTTGIVSNAEDFEFVVTVTDTDTGDLIDLSTVTEIELSIKDQQTGCVVVALTKSGGGIVVTDTGVFTASVTEAQASNLCAKTYKITGRYTNAGKTRTFLAGSLPVVDGAVD